MGHTTWIWFDELFMLREFVNLSCIWVDELLVLAAFVNLFIWVGLSDLTPEKVV